MLAIAPALPAQADETDFELRYAFEQISWSAPLSTGSAGFATPMQTFTVIDQSGILLGVVGSVLMTVASQATAESAARRRGDSTYSYSSFALQPGRGLRTSLTVGMGAPGALSGLPVPATPTPGARSTPAPRATPLPPPADARMMRFDIAGDFGQVGPGVLGWDLGFNWFAATVPPSAELPTTTQLTSMFFPLGMAYRFLAPGPVPLIVEPSAHLDALYFATQRFSLGAYDLGLNVAFPLGVAWRLHAGVTSTRMVLNGLPGVQAGPASVLGLNAGSTMTF